ncbi:hypothetical protein ACM2TF_006154, partial [Pseudomonas aeruginosa]
GIFVMTACCDESEPSALSRNERYLLYIRKESLQLWLNNHVDRAKSQSTLYEVAPATRQGGH